MKNFRVRISFKCCKTGRIVYVNHQDFKSPSVKRVLHSLAHTFGPCRCASEGTYHFLTTDLLLVTATLKEV